LICSEYGDGALFVFSDAVNPKSLVHLVTNIEQNATPLRGFSAVAGVLPKAGAAILALTILGYIGGWRYATAYYGEIGAGWFTRFLSPGQLLFESAGLVSGIAFAAFFALRNWMIEAWSLNGISRWALRLTVVAALAYASQEILEIVHLGAWATGVTVLAELCLSFGIGLSICELVGSFRAGQSRWEQRQILVAIGIVSFGLWFGPNMSGTARANLDIDSVASTLPHVSGEGLDSTWRIVAIIDGRALAVRLATQSKDRIFRVINVTDPITIDYSR
jgi:hypothetical protein